MIDQLLSRRVLIVLGKGGVGRTSVSAAISTLRAAEGAKVLAMEHDRLGPLAMALGGRPSLDPVETAPGLWTMLLDGQHQLKEYLGTVVPSRALLEAVVRSRSYRYFVDAAPGLRELIMIGKIFHELERRPPTPPWELIVLDAPATGQALGWLQMPMVAHETFGLGVAGGEARNVARLLRDPARCGVVLVSSPEPFAVSEALETHAALRELGVGVAAVIFNRSRAPHIDQLAALARAELGRAARQRRAIALIARRTGAPVIELGECDCTGAAETVHELAGQLAAMRAGQSRAQPP